MSTLFSSADLLELPERTPAGLGYIYCMEFDSNVVKIGLTRKPRSRARSHVHAASVWTGSQFVRGWLSAPHSNYEDNEFTLIEFGKERAQEVRGNEHLVGISLDEVLTATELLTYMSTPVEPRTGKRPHTVSEGWTPRKHGIPSSYTRGCRCAPCTTANTERQTRGGYAIRNQQARFAERELIDDRLIHPKPYGGHGTISAYTGCGCRCDECRQAMTQYRHAKKIKEASAS